jgi:hypothetical protein
MHIYLRLISLNKVWKSRLQVSLEEFGQDFITIGEVLLALLRLELDDQYAIRFQVFITHITSSGHPAVGHGRVVFQDVLALALGLDSLEDLVHLA